MNRMTEAMERSFEKEIERRRRTRRCEIDRLVEEARRAGGVCDRLYWTMVYDFEMAPLTTNLQQLRDLGVDVPAADELDDAQLGERLWAVIHGLARLQIYLLDTEHLADRALYERLEQRVLREEVREVPPEPGVREYIDLGPQTDPESVEFELDPDDPRLPGRGRDGRLPRPPG